MADGRRLVQQLRAQMALPDHAATPTLALLYITDHYANAAQDILTTSRPNCRA